MRLCNLLLFMGNKSNCRCKAWVFTSVLPEKHGEHANMFPNVTNKVVFGSSWE